MAGCAVVMLMLVSSPVPASAASSSDLSLTREVTAAMGPYKSDVAVRARNGVVSLSGMISSCQEKQDMLLRAGMVPGVSSIVDDLNVPTGN